MSQPLVELRNLLTGSQSTSGRVIALANGFLRVVTPGGLVEVPAATGIGIGDEVAIRNGGASRLTTGVGTPVFFV